MITAYRNDEAPVCNGTPEVGGFGSNMFPVVTGLLRKALSAVDMANDSSNGSPNLATPQIYQL